MINLVFVILTEMNKFISYSNSDNFKKSFKYPDLPKSIAASAFCWAIGRFNPNCPDLVFSLENEIYLLSFMNPAYTQLRYTFDLKSAKINQIKSNLQTSSIALYLSSGVLMFIELNDQNLIYTSEFETKSLSKPTNLIWFCAKAICCTWKDIILIVDLKRKWTTYHIDEKEPYFVIDELDGIRIISNKTHEFLEILSDDIVNIFSVGSEQPGAYLLEAYKQFTKRSHLANDYIKILENDFTLPTGIQQCIHAARCEFKITTQKLLLRAASYGKCFLPDYDPAEFIDTCLQLRVLNLVREQSVGLPLSLKQFNLIGLNRLIERLIDLEKFNLAIKISNHLALDVENGKNKVLKEWALYKVRQSEHGDEEIGNDIVKKIGNTNGISYSEIANLAVEYNRKNLAFLLLNYENKSTDQVDLLLKLDNKEEALDKAIESGNTNLIYKVILSKHYQDHSPKILSSILKLNPQAYNLYEKYLKETDRFELTNFYHVEERNNDKGFCFLKESFTNDVLSSNQATAGGNKKSELQMALDAFKLAGNDFMIGATEEQIRLLNRQKKIEEKLKQTNPASLAGLSLHETVQTLLRMKMYKQADDFRKDFKMADKKYYWLKINELARQAEWTELYNFGNAKKSPINYEPFVDVCLNFKNKYEAQKYLTKIREEFKIDYYFKCGLIEEAGQLCKLQKNRDALEELIKKCPNTIHERKLIQILNEIKV